MLSRVILKVKEKTGRIDRFTKIEAGRVLGLMEKFRLGVRVAAEDILEAGRIIQHEVAVLAVKTRTAMGHLSFWAGA